MTVRYGSRILTWKRSETSTTYNNIDITIYYERGNLHSSPHTIHCWKQAKINYPRNIPYLNLSVPFYIWFDGCPIASTYFCPSWPAAGWDPVVGLSILISSYFVLDSRSILLLPSKCSFKVLPHGKEHQVQSIKSVILSFQQFPYHMPYAMHHDTRAPSMIDFTTSSPCLHATRKKERRKDRSSHERLTLTNWLIKTVDPIG